jgi:hypothetical protein
MVFNVTFNNISVISWWSFFFGGGNRISKKKRRGRNHMVVGFTKTYAIGAYHH